MFSVKVTYHGEIRRFSFPDSTTFPTFEQLYSQLNRVFPSNNSYYLSKLLFFPDASNPGRILIGGQVHSVEEYNKCIVPFKGRSWSNASLRFSLIDGGSSMGQREFITQTVGQLPWAGSSGETFSATNTAFQPAPSPRSLFTPHSPVTFSIPPRTFSDRHTGADLLSDISNGAHDAVTPFFSFEAKSEASGTSSCCSTAQVKKEVEDLLKAFQRDLNRTVGHLSTSTIPIAVTPNDELSASTSQHIDCSLCSNPCDGPPLICNDCSTIVCSRCAAIHMAPLCNVSGSRHNFPTSDTSADFSSVNRTFIPPLPPFNDGTVPTAPRDISSPLTAASVTPVIVPPPPVIHQGIICDSCDLIIEGVRHKCLDCPDYDLCSPCIDGGAHERHNTHHQLLQIAEPGRVVVHTVHLPDDRLAPSNTVPLVPAAPASPVLHNAICDLCDSMIIGSRYKCAACPDFDTCDSCFAITKEQHPAHPFVKITKSEDYIVRERAPNRRHLARCDACDKSIVGIRYKCMHHDCPDFDLCEKCEALPISQHPDNHPMLKIRSPETAIPTVYRTIEGRHHLAQGERNSSTSSSIYDPAPESYEATTGCAVVAEAKSDFTSPFDDHNPADRSTHPPAPSLYDHCMYPVSSYHTSPQNASILEPAVDSSISLLEQLLFEHRPNQLNTSEEDTPLSHPLALLDVVDTPAVPGSWYGAGLTSIINASTEDPPVSEHESIHENQSCSLEECVAIHSSLHNESLLERPPTPPEMDQVFPSSNQSLANLLNGCQSMSDLALEDTKAQKEPAVDAVEVPLSAGYIEDVTAPDGQIFAPGVTFVKVWRMINTGIRDWPVNTEVVFVGGAQLTSGNPPPHIQSMCTVGPLKPGEDKNVWTPELKAPDAPGKYTSYWRLRDDKGQLFGDSIWVEIEVINPSHTNSEETLTSSTMIIMPDPTSPPSPTANERAISRSSTIDTEDISDDYLSDSSSVSLVSIPSSEDEADATLWAESRRQDRLLSANDRSQVTAEYVAELASQAMDYVLLYDDNTSEEE